MRNRLTELLTNYPGITSDAVIELTLADAAMQLLSHIGFADKKLLVVCDENTHAALGARIMKELTALSSRLLVLQGKVHADEAALKQLQGTDAEAFIAIGSGTISDLCKYASYLEQKPYAVFPTAPSMNGYLSANASITLHGMKETRKAHLPTGVFCDLEVMAAAPARLIRSGLGDSLCRPTAQADWLLSHLLLNTPYDPLPFELLKPYESELFTHADKLTGGDIAVIELLVKTLLVSGLGMVIAGGSYPASQGEHMIAHTMEMKHGDSLAYHGEQIGVTTLTMARIQQECLSEHLRLPKLVNWEDMLTRYLGTERAQLIAPTTRKKYQDYDTIVSRLAEHEASIRAQLRSIVLPEVTLRNVLVKAGAPTTPEELGWNSKDYEAALKHARYTRDRFTFLELQQ